MYTRFEGRRGGGVFQLSLRRLRRSDRPRDGCSFARRRDLETLTRELEWATPSPPPWVFESHRGARCWFKAGVPQLDSAWRVVEALRRAGVRVRAVRTRDPGRIVFEDRVQVIAIGPRGLVAPGGCPRGVRRQAWNGDRATIRCGAAGAVL